MLLVIMMVSVCYMLGNISSRITEDIQECLIYFRTNWHHKVCGILFHVSNYLIMFLSIELNFICLFIFGQIELNFIEFWQNDSIFFPLLAARTLL